MFFLHMFLTLLVQFGFQATFSSHVSRAKSMEGPMTFLFLSQRDLRAGEISTETVILLQIAQTCTVKGRKKMFLLQSRYQLQQLK